MASIPLEGQIRCVQREILMRERVYPVWVKNGKMRQGLASYEIAAMKAVLETLVELEKLQARLNNMEKETKHGNDVSAG